MAQTRSGGSATPGNSVPDVNKLYLPLPTLYPRLVSWCVSYNRYLSSEAYVVKRLFPVLLICLVAAPLLLAQDSGSNNSQPANAAGAWQLSWQGRGGQQQGTLQFQQDGSNLSGTFQDSQGASSSLTGSVSGNNVAFTVQIQGRMTLAFTGTITGDKMAGTFQPQGGGGGRGGHGGGGGQGNHSWTGVRQQGSSGRQSQPQQNDDEDDEVGL